MAYDPEIIAAINQRASQVKDPRKRDRYTRAALQTGIVESGLQNLPGGDADSQGWRQERKSLYPNPTNVTASVDRFFNELAQFDRGQPSWELAADVQRPAAQFRGRYKDVAKQAAALLGGGGGGSSGGPSADPAAASAPSSPSLLGGGQAGDFTSILSSLMAKPQQQPQMSAIAPPAFAAHPAMPAGFNAAPVIASPTPQPEGGVQAALSLVEALGGQAPTVGQDGAPEGAEGTAAAPIADQVATARAGGMDYTARADAIDAKRLPYKWGGGHGGKVDPYKAAPLDCSGAVSAVLGINPRVSGEFTSWGNAGDGGNKGVTVYANSKHVLMKIDGHFFGTSATNPGGGAGWIPQKAISPEYLKGFTARHAG